MPADAGEAGEVAVVCVNDGTGEPVPLKNRA